MPIWIDTHAHLDDERFREDLEAVLARAGAAGLERILTIGVDLATSRAAVDLAERYSLLRAVVGIQPNHVADAQPSDWDEIVQLARRPEVVGLGESGLDRYWDRAPFPLQEVYFARHLDLARERDLPIVIHCREADDEMVSTLQAEFNRRGPIRGVMHSFTGSAAKAQACLACGLHISFAGMLTYKNAPELRTVAATIPRNRLLVETDSPYLAPVPVRGQRNEPANVIHTGACLATLLGCTPNDLAFTTTQNARALFQLSPNRT
jgi:TatD DNase family protein